VTVPARISPPRCAPPASCSPRPAPRPCTTRPTSGS
jgi:hypothetical protein